MSIFENYLNNPQTAEWILNLLLRSICIIFIGWGIIKFSGKKNHPFIGKLSLIIMIMLILVPIIPIISGIVNSYGIDLGNNIIEINHEYLLVMPDNNINENQTEKSVNMIKLINTIGIFWMLIFIFKSLLILFKLIYLYKFKKSLKKAESNTLKATISKIFGIKNPSKIPEIYLSSVVHSPVAFGLLNPIIVIPEKFYNKLNKNELNSIAAHEMSHILRRDHLSGLLQQIILSFYWWNPFLYKISSEFSSSSEYICDNFAIKATSPRIYANTLVSLIEKTHILNRMPGLTGISSPHIDLKERIKKIIQKERKMDTKLKNYLTSIIIIISITVLGLLSSQNFIFAEKETVKDTKKSFKTEKAQKVKKAEITAESNDSENKAHKIFIKQAKRIKYVAPIFPEDAKKNKLSSIVILEATTDTEGKVVKYKIISGHPIFNQAAIDAVKQWVYEPYIVNGKKKGVTFTVTVNFTNTKKEKKK